MHASETKNSESTAGERRGQSPNPWMKVATAVARMQNTGAGMTNSCTGCGGCSLFGMNRMESTIALHTLPSGISSSTTTVTMSPNPTSPCSARNWR